MPELLRGARERAGLSQRDLARAAGSSQGTVTAYERGRMSPTVRTLDRLLATCGMQLRAELEPLLADVDARLDAALAADVAAQAGQHDAARTVEGAARTVGTGGGRLLGTPEIRSLRALQRSLDLVDPIPTHGPSLTRLPRRGPVTWALNGTSALAVHGLSLPHGAPELVVVLDEALRWWLRAIWLQPTLPDGRASNRGWLDLEPERFGVLLHGRAHHSLLGYVVVRVVTELPERLRVVVNDEVGSLKVHVLTVDAVETGHPAHAALLARWRQRRTVGA